MHSQDTINQFIDGRARSVPYAQIAAELNVSRSTLMLWGQKYRTEIETLRAVEAEALCAKYLGTREQEIEMLAKRLQKYEAEVDLRIPKYMEHRELMELIRITRSRLEKLCAEPVLELPKEAAEANPVPTGAAQ
jgi:hypothetical protein